MPAVITLILVAAFVATAFALTAPQRTVGAEDRVAVLFRATLFVLAVALIASPVALAYF